MDKLQEKRTTDSDKIVFLENFLPKNHIKAYKDNFNTGEGISYHYFDFSAFCHAYADYLLEIDSFSIYGKFIKRFNELIENDPAHKDMKEIQNSQINDHGALAALYVNYNNVFINDSRPPVKDGSFKRELDLERIITSELKDAFRENINLKRQQHHGYGKSDITINNTTTIELKRSKAERMNVYQTFEYSFDEKIENLCLIASEFDEKSLSIANKLKISCYVYEFMYKKDAKDYPVGFIIEKVNDTPDNEFDKYLNAMDDAFMISFFDPKFDFDQTLKNKMDIIYNIFYLTKQVHENNKNKLMAQLQDQGFDTSESLENVLKQLESESW